MFIKNLMRKMRMIDEEIEAAKIHNISLVSIDLIIDKEIYLIRAKESVRNTNRAFIRSLMFAVRNELVTTNYADTKLLMAEIKLFEKGNQQNKYTTLEKHDRDINLRLELSEGHIYISKAEAYTISEIYRESMTGMGTQRIVEAELKFTLQELAQLLNRDGFLKQNRGENNV